LALPYQWQWRIDRWKNGVKNLFGGEQQPRPKICPSCGALVGVNATRCHQCGASMRFSFAALTRGLSGHFGGRAPITTLLLIVNIMMFGITWVATVSAGEGGGLRILWGMNGEVLYRFGASFPAAIFGGHEWWRLVTALFLHGGLIHIGMNMMVLMQVGPALEELYGSAMFFFLYIFTGMVGFLTSAMLGHFSVGASAALLGLIGLMLAITTKRGGAYMRQLRSQLISSIVFLFVLGFMGTGIDNSAHLGGLAAGFALGKLLPDREPMTPGERNRANLFGWAAGIITVGSFVLMLLHYKDSLTGS
jgi:membrane associated rhomboid family serine protease